LALHIPDLALIGMAHQYERHRDAARRVLYVQGAWLCSLLFEITAPLGDDTTQLTRFSEFELRICPASHLQATQRADLPKFLRAPPQKPPESPRTPDPPANFASRFGRRQSLLPRRARFFPSHSLISSRALVQSLGTPSSTRSATRLLQRHRRKATSMISHRAPSVQRLNSRRGVPATHHHWPLCTMLCSPGVLQARPAQSRCLLRVFSIGLGYFVVPAYAARRIDPSLAGSVAEFGRSLVTGYTR